MSHVAHQSIDFNRTARRALPVWTSLAVSLVLGACANGSSNPLFSAPDPLLQKPSAVELALNPNAELHKATEYWAKQHAENPRDPRTAVNYVRNLKAMGSKKEALVIIQEAHRFNTTDREVNSEYGRLALEHDQLSVAQKLLEHADDPIKPDWRVISARGTVLAKQNKNAEAIPFFQHAHDIAPEQSSVLNNLAMAHAMNGQADKAETMLRDAAQKNSNDPRIAHNLALVLGLQGKHEEAKTIAEVSLPSDATRHNADVVRQMVQNDTQPEPVAAMPSGKATAQLGASRKSTASIAKPITTATVVPAAKAKTKDKVAAQADVDASELVRRLADGGAPIAATVAAKVTK